MDTLVGSVGLAPLPQGPFGAILADPPWAFATYSAKGKAKSPDGHYPTMNPEGIARLGSALEAAAAPDCALFLWVPAVNLTQGLEVVRGWGFTFKALAFVWVKTTKRGEPGFGLGYWTRQAAELCLLGTRGKPKRLSRGVRQVIMAPRREHSRKPDECRERIEALVAGPYLELFARSTRPGWNAWGNEVGKYDALEPADADAPCPALADPPPRP